MDGQQFDDFVRAVVSASRPRRQLLKGLGGGIVAATLAAVGRGPAYAQDTCATFCAGEPGARGAQCRRACRGCSDPTCLTFDAATRSYKCCGRGETCCNGACVDILFDEANCGGCGVVCPTAETPFQAIACCSGSCVDLFSDRNNCTGCGIVCQPNETCTARGFGCSASTP